MGWETILARDKAFKIKITRQKTEVDYLDKYNADWSINAQWLTFPSPTTSPIGFAGQKVAIVYVCPSRAMLQHAFSTIYEFSRKTNARILTFIDIIDDRWIQYEIINI